MNTMKIYKAPEPTHLNSYGEISIFLAGSIDMGSAENWQTKLEEDLSDLNKVVIYNPRRDDWDISWVQDPTPGTQFHEQVVWELDHISNADLVVFYFADDSKSPITLLELGLTASDRFGADIIIYCSSRFCRYGNVKIVADKFKIPVHHNYESFLENIREFVKSN